uniref:Uncharacterized protein n=1 Tax=Oryza brachyantha TaxID=4533 RepID=J3NC79_ORYBR
MGEQHGWRQEQQRNLHEWGTSHNGGGNNSRQPAARLGVAHGSSRNQAKAGFCKPKQRGQRGWRQGTRQRLIGLGGGAQNRDLEGRARGRGRQTVWRIGSKYLLKQTISPTRKKLADPHDLGEWWLLPRMNFRAKFKGAFDTLVMLTCWLIWKEHNARIFNQKFRSAAELFSDLREEIRVWIMAGFFSIFDDHG